MDKALKFFKEHMEYIAKGDYEGMVNDTYADDAVLYHNFPFFKGESPYIARGKKEIIDMEKVIFDPKNQGKITAGDPFNFVATEDFIGFQIIVTSPNTGKWLNTDAWVLRDGKITQYYAMGYLIEPPKK